MDRDRQADYEHTDAGPSGPALPESDDRHAESDDGHPAIDGRRVLVLETGGFQFLIDPRDLWKPPRVLVRRGITEAEVWLDEEDLSIMRSRFAPHDERLVLSLVLENIDDLLMWWCTLKDDVRRDRLERNVLVD